MSCVYESSLHSGYFPSLCIYQLCILWAEQGLPLWSLPDHILVGRERILHPLSVEASIALRLIQMEDLSSHFRSHLSIIDHTVGETQLWLSNASRTVNHKQMLPEFDSPHWPEEQLSHSRVIPSWDLLSDHHGQSYLSLRIFPPPSASCLLSPSVY